MQNIGLVEIFGHSKRHIFYDKLPVRVIRDDVVESYEMIEKTLDASRFFWSDYETGMRKNDSPCFKLSYIIRFINNNLT